MYRFLIIIEKANGNYSAYSPDLAGCIATGTTREEAAENMHKAIELHLQGLQEDGLPVPESHSFAEYVAVPARNVLKLTESIPFDQAAILGCAVSTAYHALRRGRTKAGDTILIMVSEDLVCMQFSWPRGSLGQVRS